MRVRVHQHVNPLSPHYTRDHLPLDLEQVFMRSDQPLHLDIGCARGRYLLQMAPFFPERNFLGLEIREPLVDEANRLATERGMKNLRYEFCNALLYFSTVISEIPDGVLKTVTIQFPDPWFKKKHAKRRMVNAPMAAAIHEKLTGDGMVLIQTDIEFLAEEMFAIFRAHGGFIETVCDENPFPVKTEREISVETRSLPVYRRIFSKK